MPRKAAALVEDEDEPEDEPEEETEEDDDFETYFEDDEEEDDQDSSDADEDDEEPELNVDLSRLHGHANIRANICFDCHGPLMSAGGAHSEYHYDDGTVSFAAAVCTYCKMVREFENWGHVIAPQDLKEVIARLRAHNNGVNYAVACWVATVVDQQAGTIVDRKYCVNLNGEIVTRKDTFDLRRSLKSLETDGWEVYTPKVKIKNVEHALHLVAETLEPRGYRRQF